MAWRAGLSRRVTAAAACALIVTAAVLAIALAATAGVRAAGRELSQRLVPAAATAGSLLKAYQAQQGSLRDYVTSGQVSQLATLRDAGRGIPAHRHGSPRCSAAIRTCPPSLPPPRLPSGSGWPASPRRNSAAMARGDLARARALQANIPVHPPVHGRGAEQGGGPAGDDHRAAGHGHRPAARFAGRADQRPGGHVRAGRRDHRRCRAGGPPLAAAAVHGAAPCGRGRRGGQLRQPHSRAGAAGVRRPGTQHRAHAHPPGERPGRTRARRAGIPPPVRGGTRRDPGHRHGPDRGHRQRPGRGPVRLPARRPGGPEDRGPRPGRGHHHRGGAPRRLFRRPRAPPDGRRSWNCPRFAPTAPSSRRRSACPACPPTASR